MGYWKAKVLPKLKKVFDNNGKKAAAVEACKSFDDSKVRKTGSRVPLHIHTHTHT